MDLASLRIGHKGADLSPPIKAGAQSKIATVWRTNEYVSFTEDAEDGEERTTRQRLDDHWDNPAECPISTEPMVLGNAINLPPPFVYEPMNENVGDSAVFPYSVTNPSDKAWIATTCGHGFLARPFAEWVMHQVQESSRADLTSAHFMSNYQVSCPVCRRDVNRHRGGWSAFGLVEDVVNLCRNARAPVDDLEGEDMDGIAVPLLIAVPAQPAAAAGPAAGEPSSPAYVPTSPQYSPDGPFAPPPPPQPPQPPHPAAPALPVDVMDIFDSDAWDDIYNFCIQMSVNPPTSFDWDEMTPAQRLKLRRLVNMINRRKYLFENATLYANQIDVTDPNSYDQYVSAAQERLERLKSACITRERKIVGDVLYLIARATQAHNNAIRRENSGLEQREARDQEPGELLASADDVANVRRRLVALIEMLDSRSDWRFDQLIDGTDQQIYNVLQTTRETRDALTAARERAREERQATFEASLHRTVQPFGTMVGSNRFSLVLQRRGVDRVGWYNEHGLYTELEPSTAQDLIQRVEEQVALLSTDTAQRVLATKVSKQTIESLKTWFMRASDYEARQAQMRQLARQHADADLPEVLEDIPIVGGRFRRVMKKNNREFWHRRERTALDDLTQARSVPGEYGRRCVQKRRSLFDRSMRKFVNTVIEIRNP